MRAVTRARAPVVLSIVAAIAGTACGDDAPDATDVAGRSAGVGAGAGAGMNAAAGTSAGTSGRAGSSAGAGTSGAGRSGGAGAESRGGAGASGASGSGGSSGGGSGGGGGSAGSAGSPNEGPPYTRECTFEQPTECKLCEVQTTCEAPRYTVNGDGTVTSSCCGFVWQQVTEWVIDPASPNDNCLDRPGAPGCYDFEGAQAHCASLTLAGDGWRAPTIAELASLVVWSIPTGPRIDTTAFPNAPVSDRYWSSSESADNPNEAWRVLFGGTPGGRGPKSREHFVRCVR